MDQSAPHTTTLPQGDPHLLTTELAIDLLGRAIPARLAYTAPDGTPRIVPTWFHWDGREIVMATWLRGSHVRHPARRIEHLRRRPEVAISIDTDDQPPVVLSIRGRARIEEVEGIVEEYHLAARRYLGDEVGDGYISQFDQRSVAMARISVRPERVHLLDFDVRMPGPLGGVAGTA